MAVRFAPHSVHQRRLHSHFSHPNTPSRSPNPRPLCPLPPNSPPPERVTVIVPLNQGYYDADNKDIHWYAANGKIVLHQWKANSTTNVSSSYVAAPRLYKEHILHFQALNGYKLLGATINYAGQYKGDSLIAGTELDDTGANVIDDEVAVARRWGTANDGEHILSVRSLDGVSDLYLQNVAATVVQLRITSISVIYKNIV